jgi:hypothetical protein
MIVIDLNKRLPPRYVASPRVHLGASFEIGVATIKEDKQAAFLVAEEAIDRGSNGGATTATATWAPPQPTLVVATDLPDQDEYEVRVYDTERRRRLVAAIEIVSPANKDRPEHRRAFVAKCAALLQQGVSVAILDLVTTRRFNLYAELLEMIGQSDPSLLPAPPTLYAVACRWREEGQSWRLEAWAHSLVLGQSLPTLPLWLAPGVAVPLELEPTYEEPCRILRIP